MKSRVDRPLGGGAIAGGRVCIALSAIAGLGACGVRSQSDPSPQPLQHPWREVAAGVRAYERGDRAEAYEHVTAVWIGCDALGREALVIAIAAELDPTNPHPRFDRAADFAAASLDVGADSAWTAAMTRALEDWSRAFRDEGGSSAAPPAADFPPAGSAERQSAAMLHGAVLRGARPGARDACAESMAADSMARPGRQTTSRAPSPRLVARILELEGARLDLASDRTGLEVRIRELEQELERLRKLLKP